jgi:hypothetical protein
MGGDQNAADFSYYSNINGGYLNYFSGGGYGSVISGGYQNTMTAYAFSNINGGYCNSVGGRYSSTTGGGNLSMGSAYYTFALAGQNNVGNGQTRSGFLGGAYRTLYATYTTCFQNLSKAGGYFSIPHPDPAKTQTHTLLHSFVESPNEGDNIYRYVVTTSNCQATLELPDYFKYLNKNETIKIAPVNHFGKAYGVIDPTQSCVDLTSNFDGDYNVLIFGTRKDEAAVWAWSGTERIKAVSASYVGLEGR